MATVTYFLPKGAKPTQEQLNRLAELKDWPITYDEDCPDTTDEEVEETLYLMRKYNTRRITKEILMKEFPERFKKRTVS